MKIPNWIAKIDKILDYLINKITYIILFILFILLGAYCRQELYKEAAIEALNQKYINQR